MEAMKERLFRLKAALLEKKDRILLFFGLLAIGGLSFGAGMLQGKGMETKPVVIEIPSAPAPVVASDEAVSGNKVSLAAASVRSSTPVAVSEKGACVFVGSRNSDKYHLPTCSFAKRIKPENRVCFATKEDAEKRGYKPGCLR